MRPDAVTGRVDHHPCAIGGPGRLGGGHDRHTCSSTLIVPLHATRADELPDPADPAPPAQKDMMIGILLPKGFHTAVRTPGQAAIATFDLATDASVPRWS